MISDATATIAGAVIAGVFTLGGVWAGYAFSRLATEKDRRAEKLYKLYADSEFLANVLVANRDKQVTEDQFLRLWHETTERMMVSLIGSGLARAEIRRVLEAINGKWEDPDSVSRLRELADELLNRVDSDYAKAASELLKERGVTRDDIEPVVLRRPPGTGPKTRG